MKSVIVGTAGHIDHGKTALVKALTGIDADRLEEEKRRGITIDLGFAHMELPGPDGTPLRLGFVDVPGHERFVRNMLAGVGGIDLVLFVIAADEGIKPQTREHFDICRLLNIARGITVLTKCDLVDRDTLEVVRLEVEDFLRGSFLDAARAPIIAASARTGAGIPELKQALARVAFEARQKESAALFRLPVDRVFVMKGFGTVVTGTLVAGSIGKDEEVEVYPVGRRVRVRGIEVHGQPAERARAGERTALNLAGVAKEELARGMTLAPPSLLRSTERADVSLTLLAEARPLRDRSHVHLHAYSAETVAEVMLYDDKQLSPGSTAFAQLRLEDAMLLLPGDRFIVRQFSPVVTIGGGTVLDASPAQRKQDYTPGFLSILATGDGESAFKARVARRGHNGLSLAEAIAETGWTRETVENLAAPQVQARRMLRVGDVFVHGPALEALHSVLVDRVKDFHRKNPLVPGMSKEELREELHLRPEILDAALATLVAGRKVEVLGEQVRLPGRGVVLSDEEAAARRTIEQAFLTAGLKVPALKEVLAGLPVDKTRSQKIVTLLLRDKVLVKLGDDLVFHSSALAELRRRIAEYKSTSAKIDVARFKDLAGVSRKYAIPLLEYLDRERVTRRVGDERAIL
ncbi:MAG TPA: selenocysteine-specific translation elongation factor [Terriglobales bacterium]|nr:selenocysteine-specific translation elongation factor [Terriglobales bacterium]